MTALPTDQIAQQLAFLMELDKLKSVLRQSPLINQSRKENSAEHSWHLSMFALVLSAHAQEKVDTLHVIKLLMVHDIVEIDAGDHPIHSSSEPSALIAHAEQQAAERILGYYQTPVAAKCWNSGANLKWRKPPKRSLQKHWIGYSLC